MLTPELALSFRANCRCVIQLHLAYTYHQPCVREYTCTRTYTLYVRECDRITERVMVTRSVIRCALPYIRSRRISETVTTVASAPNLPCPVNVAVPVSQGPTKGSQLNAPFAAMPAQLGYLSPESSGSPAKSGETPPLRSGFCVLM